MNTINRRKAQFSVIAVAALAIAIIATALAVTFPTGPAQAQNAGNAYVDPQPCGPGAATATMAEPHEVTTGHFALFEAYWYTTTPGLDDDAAGVGDLYTNECPPKMVKTKQGRKTVTTRAASNIDIEEAIMHVEDTRLVNVVATNAEATSGQLSLEEYPAVRGALGLGDNDPVLPGTQVWWLQLDDPDTAADDTSDLRMGFSTVRLDDNYWHRPGTDAAGNPHKAMRYKLEVESAPSDPSQAKDVPHLFAYKAPKSGNAVAEPVWNSLKPGDERTDLVMGPEEYETLQWIFVNPGTHVLTVELQGHVRKTNPHRSIDPEYDENWKPISNNDFETTAAKYTFQVGDTLEETEPPIFGVNLSVAENSPAGVNVGNPIPVYNADADVLYYELSGEEHEHFNAVAGTDPHTVQIVVKEGASLDYETRPSYDLSLTVTDKLDHEGNRQREDKVEVDDTLLVRIALEDQAPGLHLQADRGVLDVGETVNLVARFEPTPQQRGQTFTYQWAEQIQTGNGVRWHVISSAPDAPTWSVSQSSATMKTYRAAVVLGDDSPPTFVNSNEVEIFWGN